MTEALTDRSRNLLAAMGIDVYRLRTGQTTEALIPPRPAPEKRSASAPAPAAETKPAPVEVDAPATPAATPTASRADTAPAVAPFAVLCLRKAHALVIVEASVADGPRQKAERRFAVDLLAAATGAWGGETAAVPFNWPQPGIDNTAPAQQKALAAFLRKQVDDAQATVLLVDDTLDTRLGSAELAAACPGAARIPALAALMNDGALKKQLWRTLGQSSGE